MAALVKAHPEVFQLETVGAVALDSDGNVAAATSTGGFPRALLDAALTLVLAKTVCDYIENGKTPQEAVERR